MSARTAVVVPGHGGRRRSGGRISSTCVLLLREAERIAETRGVDAVVLTGGAFRGGPPEAEQMRSEWTGPDVELVVEPTASITAENAGRTLPLLVERRIRRAVVVCAPFHVYRTRFFFSRIYGARGIQAEFHVAKLPPRPAALAWELAAAPLCRRQLRAVEAELADLGAS